MDILLCFLETDGSQISFSKICGEVLRTEIKRNTHYLEDKTCESENI